MPKSFAGIDVLVTGGAGFIGWNLVRALRDAGANVMVIDAMHRECGGRAFHVSSALQGSDFLCDTLESRHPQMISMVKKAKLIFHLAGQSQHWQSMEAPLSDLTNNCTALLALLDTCRRYNPAVHILFTSTRQVYGVPESLPVQESHPLSAVDVNGIHKMMCEQYLHLYEKLYNIAFTAVRLSNTYGPGMHVRDPNQSFLGHWIRLAIEGTNFEVWGGRQLRDLTYVDDVVNALMKIALRSPGNHRVYNVGGKDVVSLSQVAARVTSLTGTEHTVIVYPEDRKKIDIGDYYADCQLLQKEVGWEPGTSLDAGLAKTIDYYRHHLPEYLSEE